MKINSGTVQFLFVLSVLLTLGYCHKIEQKKQEQRVYEIVSEQSNETVRKLDSKIEFLTDQVLELRAKLGE